MKITKEEFWDALVLPYGVSPWCKSCVYHHVRQECSHPLVEWKPDNPDEQSTYNVQNCKGFYIDAFRTFDDKEYHEDWGKDTKPENYWEWDGK